MSFVQVPPDGGGKKIFTKTHTVGPNQVEAQVQHLADGASPDNLLSIDARGSAAVRFAEGQPILSGFGNLKVAQERALGVYESSLETYAALFSKESALGGTAAYSTTESSEILEVTGVSGSSVSLTTNRYHYYLPGTSNIYKFTISVGDTGKVGNTRRWGAFDANDGVFFELKDTTVNVVIRSSTSGTVTELRVPQASWNSDKLDGTGVSGVTIDWTKINVFWLDYQWLGAGRVRFGIFAPDGSRITSHVFENAGGNALPYMRTGTLPARLENVNTGATGSSSQLRSVCIGVYAEGTYEDYAFWRFSDIDADVASVITDTPVASIRTISQINGKHNSVIIYPETLNVYCDQPVAITMWQDTTVTGGTWESLVSALEVNYDGAIYTSYAQKFKTIYLNTGATSIDLDAYFEKNDEGVQTAANGVPEVWSFVATRLTANPTAVKFNLGYKELW